MSKVWPYYHAYTGEQEPPNMIATHSIWIIWPVGAYCAMVFPTKPERSTTTMTDSAGTTTITEKWEPAPSEALAPKQMATRFGQIQQRDVDKTYVPNFPRDNEPHEVILKWADGR